MSKYGFNPNELRKTIVTQIDKDGFHNRTVTYGKDSGESENSDWSIATILFKNNTSTPFQFRRPIIIYNNDVTSGLYIDIAGTFQNGSSDHIEIVLYKGRVMVPFAVMITSDIFNGDFFSSFKLDLSGNVELADRDDSDYLLITGDCEITINNYDESPL